MVKEMSSSIMSAFCYRDSNCLRLNENNEWR